MTGVLFSYGLKYCRLYESVEMGEGYGKRHKSWVK